MDCDAGHGCTVSCPGGCYAIFVHDTGECLKGCDAIMLKAGGSHRYTIHLREFPPDRIGPLLDAFSIREKPNKSIDFRIEYATADEVAKALREAFEPTRGDGKVI